MAPLLGGIFGILLVYFYYDLQISTIDLILTMLSASMTFMVVNSANNILNQITDIGEDSINKPYRPLPSGKVKSEEAWFLCFILYLFGMVRAFTMSIAFGLITAMIITFTFLYSMPPARLKKRFILSSLAQAIPRGYLSIIATWSLFGYIWNPVPHILGAFMTLFLIGGANIKDFADYHGDKLYGIKTLPVTLGIKKAIWFIYPWLFIPFLWLAVCVILQWLPIVSIILFCLAPVSLTIWYYLWENKRIKGLENDIPWLGMYLWLGIAFILMPVVFL